MAPPYTRKIDRPTGKIYFDPGNGIQSQGVPAVGLSPTGEWIPLLLDADGSVVISNEMQGTPHFDDEVVDVTPGLEQVLLSQVVPANVTRMVRQIIVTTRVTGVFWVTLDGDVVGSGRTGPGGYPLMPYSPPRPFPAGSTYEVRFISRLNAPPQTVECYLQASDTGA